MRCGAEVAQWARFSATLNSHVCRAPAGRDRTSAAAALIARWAAGGTGTRPLPLPLPVVPVGSGLG